MKKYIIIILCVLLMNTIKAQEWPPDEAKWHYSYNNFWVSGYIEIQTVSDTLINDYSFKKLEKIRYTYDGMTEEYDTVFIGAEFIRSDEDKVYIFRNGQSYTLYDFSAEVGDTWQIPMTYEISEFDTVGTVVVTARGDTVVDSQTLRYIVVEPTEFSDWSLYGTVIEKVGSVSGYLLPEQNTDWADIFEGGPFRCYVDNDINLEQGTYPCTYITSVAENPMVYNELQVYPNPAKEMVTFKLPEAKQFSTLLITDIYGKTIEQLKLGDNQSKILWDCRNTSAGIYSYRIEIDNMVYRGKVIIE